jgi:hypothetical protein
MCSRLFVTTVTVRLSAERFAVRVLHYENEASSLAASRMFKDTKGFFKDKCICQKDPCSHPERESRIHCHDMFKDATRGILQSSLKDLLTTSLRMPLVQEFQAVAVL